VPIISKTLDYNGFVNKVARLGLSALVGEATATLSLFQLLVEEKKHANGTQGLRRTIDEGFSQTGGWTKIASGGIDWTKSNQQGGRVGVEVQVSGRSDMLAVDIMHLKDQIEAGAIDVGVIIVPDDDLSYFLTDRTPNLRTAVKHVQDKASNLPIRVLAFKHDGVGLALTKMRTNLGKTP
jgi:hypothetical protein